jgi:hypothetical protein
VSPAAPAHLEPEAPERQIDVIVKDQEPLRRDFVIESGGPDRLTRLVHEPVRREIHHLRLAEPGFGDLAVNSKRAAAEALADSAQQAFEDLEPDVVAGSLIIAPRVA